MRRVNLATTVLTYDSMRHGKGFSRTCWPVTHFLCQNSPLAIPSSTHHLNPQVIGEVLGNLIWNTRNNFFPPTVHGYLQKHFGELTGKRGLYACLVHRPLAMQMQCGRSVDRAIGQAFVLLDRMHLFGWMAPRRLLVDLLETVRPQRPPRMRTASK